MKNPAVIYLALGSNLGNRLENLHRALKLISDEITITGQSSIYETPPWGILEQPRFYNQVLKGQTNLTPHQLLDFLKSVERKMGRVDTVRYGPRIIDVDILIYGRRIVDTERLQIPHLRMHERAFVLVPLAEIAPHIVIPDQILTVTDILKTLDQNGIVKIDV